jgi:outer membrane lipoprotein-sorting protein
MMAPALTGCLVHHRSVLKTRPPDLVYSTSLDEMLKRVDDRYTAIHSMTASVQVVACTGGASKGEVTCVTPFNGHIVIGKPENILFLLEAPILGSRELQMVSDGKTFKMLIPRKSCAITGSDVVTNSTQTGMYALRPAVILDSLLIRGIQPDQDVALTQGDRIIPDPKTRKDNIDEPTYDLNFLSQPEGRVAHSLRVIHISSANLLPYQQDIYNADGKVATQATYKNYQKFGDISFPTVIEIQRPLDQLSLTITITKSSTSFNQELAPDQFDIGPIPASFTTYNMDNPAVAATTPCAAHAPQSTH